MLVCEGILLINFLEHLLRQSTSYLSLICNRDDLSAHLHGSIILKNSYFNFWGILKSCHHSMLFILGPWKNSLGCVKHCISGVLPPLQAIPARWRIAMTTNFIPLDLPLPLGGKIFWSWKQKKFYINSWEIFWNLLTMPCFFFPFPQCGENPPPISFLLWNSFVET